MDLTPVQRAVLEHLYRHGDDVPANIAESGGFHRNSVSRGIPDLEDDGLIRTKGHGVWTLTPAGQRAARRLYRDSESTS